MGCATQTPPLAPTETVTIQPAAPDPASWDLVWSDEFDQPDGTALPTHQTIYVDYVRVYQHPQWVVASHK
jgi:hypothetical protein